MEEGEHLVKVLEGIKRGLANQDILALKDLSNQTIHCASSVQDRGSITIAVIVYAIGKLLERKEHMNIENWDNFTKKFNLYIDMALKAVRDKNETKYEDSLMNARKAITSISVNLKSYIEEIIRKASINKASKIYEHGISLGRTAELLGVTEWELSDYTGQGSAAEASYNRTISTKERARKALEFFS